MRRFDRSLVRERDPDVHGNVTPKIANSAIGIRIEERMRHRLGPTRNIKGDRKRERPAA